jgi:alcohol dehydrogenase (cytochrome c)
MGERPGSEGGTGVVALLVLVLVAVVGVAALLAYVATAGTERFGGDTTGEDAAPRRWPARAPAFTAEDLTAQPTTAWLTNGGTLSNQRYSPLDAINVTNVGELAGVWRRHLRGSGTAAKYSAEGQPIVYDGVIYVPTGEDDVFAVDVAGGKIRWKYESGISQKIDTICCGWLSRGVALGDGKVFIGQLDGMLVALDQETGKRLWKTKVGDWRNGYTITAAPLYYDGKVITGVSGGEFSIRGSVQAYDAETGKLVWRWHTIPGPGEEGHDSWPATGRAWTRGGAPMWQTPAVDPELGLVYFSTGNASPDLDGSRRPGDNLFAASIVALDAATGEYRWHFQQVHHDIWDYDSPSPVVLFDAEIDGDDRAAIAQTSKTGWTYVLDRETGEPILPIEETPVPQDPVQRTSATQPVPQYEPFIPHDVTARDVAEIRKLAAANPEIAGRKLVPGDIFEPFRGEVRVIVPGPQGGVNWQPTSYNPETGLLYICAMRPVAGYTRTGKRLPVSKQGRVSDFGSVFTTTGFGAQTGFFGAWDPATGEVAWRKRWPESCYSGTTTTAGGLVFVGRNSGHLEAYDAESGKRLWRFQTGAGANSTVTVFEQDGTEYVAFLAGGNALAATPHGDNLWLFSLDGTVGPASGAGAGEGVGHAGESPVEPTDTGKGDPAAGQQVFADNCSGCHGLNGQGGNGGPSLADVENLKRIVAQVTNGGGGMPPFKGTLTAQQINDVAAFVQQRVGR